MVVVRVKLSSIVFIRILSLAFKLSYFDLLFSRLTYDFGKTVVQQLMGIRKSARCVSVSVCACVLSSTTAAINRQ